MHPLKGLRLQLTAWYAGTFSLILLLLGLALFFTLSAQLSGDLDLRLESTIADVRRTTEVRKAYGTPPEAALSDAVAEMHGADRLLYLFGPDGEPILSPRPVDRHILAAATAVLRGPDEVATDEFGTTRGQRWRLRAERIVPGDTSALALVTIADATSYRHQFERLLETFIAAALLGLVPVAIGGYHIARVSAGRVERAMTRLRDFTADAAHELRTPVAVIRGRAELAVERERDAAAYSAALHDVAGEADKLGHLVDNLLMLARADAGERPQKRDRLFLDDLATEAVDRMAILGAQRGVRVSLGRFEETLVIGDAELLREVLMILLDNAVKFTPQGGTVRVDVFTDERHPTLVVEDSGVGIAPEHLAHVFERFYRGGQRHGPARGSGLGLAIARWILEEHGAHIDLASAPDRGTRVRIRFPTPAVARHPSPP